MIKDGDFQRHLSREGMGGTTETRIISAESHLNLVQHAFRYDGAFLDQTTAALLMDMLMGA